MLIETITGAVVEGFVKTITEQFINKKRVSIEITELRTSLLSIQDMQGETHKRLTAVEQLVRQLADHEPFLLTPNHLVVQPSLTGASVENALAEFSSSVIAQIKDERRKTPSTGEVPSQEENNPLRQALSGFHEELRSARQQPYTERPVE